MKELHQTEIHKIFDITKIITLFRADLKPSECYEQETYNFWEMLYMEDGERTIRIGDTQHCVLSGQVLFYPPDIPHQCAVKAEKTCKIGLVSFVCPSQAMSFFEHKIFTLRSSEKIILSNILKMGGSVFRWFEPECKQRGMYAVKDTDPAMLYRIKLDIETLLMALYTEYLTATKITDYETAKKRNQNKETIKFVTDFMKQNLNNNLAVEQISKECGLSVSTLKRIFKEETGSGIIEYFNDLKISKAIELIENSSLNISQISEQLGYSSPFYFSRLFKQKLGVSPLEYSKKANP